MINLENKVVLITGACGALGRATTQVFAQVNARLVLIDINQESLKNLSQELNNVQHSTYSCDLTNENEVAQLVNAIVKENDRIDVLLNIAGGFAMGPMVHELSQQDFNHMFNMNFMSAFNTCKKVIPQMMQQGSGRIVNISARAATEGKSKMAPYCISKSAVITLTESLAAEHKQNDININGILPGTIDTQTNRKDMPNADHSTWVPPTDLANTMLFLSSDLANSINGAIVPVYGRS